MPGKWKIINLSDSKWLVNVTAQSQLDFDVVLLQTMGDGTSHKISANPILGLEYYEIYSLHVAVKPINC
jgi:hypothetical protein